MNRVTLEQLAEYDTALLANLVGYVDPTPTDRLYMSNEIRSLIPGVEPTVGLAVTCEMDTSTPDDQAHGTMEGYWQQLEQIESMNVPVVWVVSCVGSRRRHECVLGDGMGKALSAAGCVGAVTDGGVRDLAGLRSIGFGAYGVGVTIHHCQMRLRQTGVAVTVGGITVQPGDIIHANSEGVIRIPASAVGKLLERAPDYRAFEHAAHQLLRRTDISSARKRVLLNEVIEKYGFNHPRHE